MNSLTFQVQINEFDRPLTTSWEADYFDGRNVVKCSDCGGYIDLGLVNPSTFTYCPYCGKKKIFSTDDYSADIEAILRESKLANRYGKDIEVSNLIINEGN